MTALPGWIGAAFDRKLDHVSRAMLRDRAQAISEAYRAGGSSEIIRSETDALAYALVRMPATYAAAGAALEQTAGALPGFAPASLLDVGTGPGTAAWAALAAFPSLTQATLIDRNRHLLALARTLHETPGAPPADIAITPSDLGPALGSLSIADMVLASYALTELPDTAADAALTRLWDLTGHLLLIVEPGTQAGFRRILAYREKLLASGASIAAPCSHHAACPLRDEARWCHFGVRLPRTRDHLLVKDASVPFEDEKFTYLAAVKGMMSAERGKRVLATPHTSKAAITLTLCAPGVAERLTIPKRDKETFRRARRCDWGDAWRAPG